MALGELMGGGFLVSLDPGLYRSLSDALVELGGQRLDAGEEGAGVQLSDEAGRLFTLWDRVPAGTEWEVTEGPVTPRPSVSVPDLGRVSAYPFECRWPELVVRVGSVAARRGAGRTWLLDGDGVLWDVADVDPAEVRL